LILGDFDTPSAIASGYSTTDFFLKSSTQLKTLLNAAYTNLHSLIWNNLPRLDIKRQEINSV